MSNFKPMHDKNDSNVISVVEKDYFNEKRLLADGTYGLTNFYGDKFCLIQFNETDMDAPRRDLCKLLEDQSLLFPRATNRYDFLPEKHTIHKENAERVFRSQYYSIFEIKCGDIMHAAINTKTCMGGINKFWGLNIDSYEEALTRYREIYDYSLYGKSKYPCFPNHFLINFVNESEISFVATQTLFSEINNFNSYVGTGNLLGPSRVETYRSGNRDSRRFYKKYLNYFKALTCADGTPTTKFLLDGKQVRFSVDGKPLAINEFANGVKDGWQITLFNNNKINPETFDSSDLAESDDPSIRHKEYFINGKKTDNPFSIAEASSKKYSGTN